MLSDIYIYIYIYIYSVVLQSSSCAVLLCVPVPCWITKSKRDVATTIRNRVMNNQSCAHSSRTPINQKLHFVCKRWISLWIAQCFRPSSRPGICIINPLTEIRHICICKSDICFACISVCMCTCMFFLAPNSIFCSMAFHRLAHHDGALPWGQCGICGTSLRPPFHGLRDPPWPNLTVYEWVQVWWLDSSEGWRWVCEWQWLPCHASCVMAPRAGGAWAGGQPMHTCSEDCFL